MADINEIRRQKQWWSDEVNTLKTKLAHAEQEYRAYSTDLTRAEEEEKRKKIEEDRHKSSGR